MDVILFVRGIKYLVTLVDKQDRQATKRHLVLLLQPVL
jgi:hypothetical protein